MNAQDKNDEKQQRPDGGYWAESRNDPGTTNGELSNGKDGASATAAGSPTDDDSNLTGTDSQPNDESEQEHAMHMSGQRYDAAEKDATSTHGAGSGGSGMGEAGALSHETSTPGQAGGTSASGTSDADEGDVTLGSGGTGAGLPDGTKGN